ncbi:hypothetical protein SH528x_006233 [Novipirellula sp. SH528]|uniref:hypothetical protein n=1 Tax=Novipirellula sp. SH528 TaxID=3454466 RepID=UPI003F9F157C
MKIFKKMLYSHASFLIGATMIKQHQDGIVSMKLDRVTQEDSPSNECSCVDHHEYLAIFGDHNLFALKPSEGRSVSHPRSIPPPTILLPTYPCGTWHARDGLKLFDTLSVAPHSNTEPAFHVAAPPE